MTCWYWAATASLLVWAKIVETRALTGLERAEPSLEVMLRAKRGAAALPGGPGQDGPDGGADAGVGVTGDQHDPGGILRGGDLEPPLSQGPQEGRPEISGLGVPQGHSQDLPAAFGRHAGGHHQRPADHPVPHAHVQVGGARRTGGGTRCDPATGRGTP